MAKKTTKTPKAKPVAEAKHKPIANSNSVAPSPAEAARSAPPVPSRTFEDLVAQAEAETARPIDPMRFKPPEVDEAKREGRGIRKLQSEHLTLYTDVASSPAVDELPQIFDLAVPQWLAYFGIKPERGAKWHMVGVLAKEKERFFDTGLWPQDLPPFLHGYMRDNQLWLYEQPSDFYRRHLLLHEGTHGFMWAYLGGLGPPWYTEGMAELLGTHEWKDGKLALGAIPRSKELSPMWGRVKVIKEGFAANKALPLGGVFRIQSRAFLQTEPYAWCWGTAVFFDHDPKYQKAFRDAHKSVADVTQTFSERLLNQLPEPPEQVAEQWQCFVANVEYGYDVAQESIVRKPAETFPGSVANVDIAADRGWQSSGWLLEAGKTYEIQAHGQFQIGRSSKPWMSEANGITLRYYKERPIGMLLAAVSDEGRSGGVTGLIQPAAIGIKGELTPEKDGVLYLRINDSSAELADNAGQVTVMVQAKQ